MAEFVRHFLCFPSNHLVSYCWARLYRTEIIKKYGVVANEEMHLFEDLVFNLEYLKYASSVIFVNRHLYDYVMHNEHVSASMAVLDAHRLLRDMEIFSREVAGFLEAELLQADIDREIGHALSHYAIIFIIRSCRLVSWINWREIYRQISELVASPFFQGCLRHYAPRADQSRLLPRLMRYKLIGFIILVGYYKAVRRYGKFTGNSTSA
jgi:hypothetical protein